MFIPCFYNFSRCCRVHHLVLQSLIHSGIVIVQWKLGLRLCGWLFFRAGKAGEGALFEGDGTGRPAAAAGPTRVYAGGPRSQKVIKPKVGKAALSKVSTPLHFLNGCAGTLRRVFTCFAENLSLGIQSFFSEGHALLVRLLFLFGLLRTFCPGLLSSVAWRWIE